MSIPQSRARKAAWLAILSLVLPCILLGANSAFGARQTPEAPHSDPKATPTSPVEPRFEPFALKAEPIAQRESVASEGDCAPRYRKAGASGTCIEQKPCRGFGVIEKGRAVCACFATRGGCAVDERCDPRGAQCVKDDDSEPLGLSR